MPGRVDGKAIVITGAGAGAGAGSGIGRDLAYSLARDGAHVGGLDLDDDPAIRRVGEIAATGGRSAVMLSRNASVPSVVDTPLWTRLDAELVGLGDARRPGQAVAMLAAGILRGRSATPDDIVGTALFLASIDSDHLTGQVVMADGGMVLV